MSGAGEQRTVPHMQSLRAALVLSRREQISVIVAVLLIGAAALLPVFGKAYWLSIGISEWRAVRHESEWRDLQAWISA